MKQSTIAGLQERWECFFDEKEDGYESLFLFDSCCGFFAVPFVLAFASPRGNRRTGPVSRAQKPSAEIIVLAEYRRRFVHDRPYFVIREECRSGCSTGTSRPH
jgi:hypothetical protein